MSITICDTHLVRTVRYLSLTFEPVYRYVPFDLLLSVLKYLDSYAALFLLPHYINILSCL